MATNTDLYEFFNALDPSVRCTFTDMFASLCWMHQQGKTVAAIKLLRDLFNQVCDPLNDDHFALAETVLETLPGNQKAYALAVPLRAEFRALFNQD